MEDYLKKALEILRPHAGDFPLSEPNKTASGQAFALISSALAVLEISRLDPKHLITNKNVPSGWGC